MAGFLDDLKNAVNSGEFNSEAAKKIIEINKLADGVKVRDIEEKQKNIKPDPALIVSEEEAIKQNAEYQMKMDAIKKQDLINKNIATIEDIEDMVKASIEDMLSFTSELENRFSKEFEDKDPVFEELSKKIEEIKWKYGVLYK